MDIFEKQKLSDIASVEQVCVKSYQFLSLLISDKSVVQPASMRKEKHPRALLRKWYLFWMAETFCKLWFWCRDSRYFVTDIYTSNMRKVRIIALYIQYRDGVPDEDRRRLYQHARLTLAEQDAVNALVHLGVRLSRVSLFTP